MLTIITGVGPGCWDEYASRTIPEIARLWPADRFIVYAEQGSVPKVTRGWEVRYAEDVPGFREFRESAAVSPIFSGRRPGPMHHWKPREIDRGYAYRWDMAKFGKMAIYSGDAARQAKPGILVWLDADVMTYRMIPRSLVECTLRDGADVAFLGRGRKHSETGYVAFRVPEGISVATTWGYYYLSRKVLSLPQWHSAFVFDVAVRERAKAPMDLTPGGTGHVWFQGPFRDYADHMKGIGRKRSGASTQWKKKTKLLAEKN